MSRFIRAVRQSIIVQMALLILLIMCVLAGMIVQSFRAFQKLERDNANVLANTILTQSENSLNSYYKSLENTAKSFSYSPTVLQYYEDDSMAKVSDISELRTVFSNMLLLNHHIQTVFLYNNRMELLAGLGGDYSLPERQQRLRTVGELSVDYYAGEDQKPCFAYYLPVYDLSSDEYMDQLGMCVFVMDSSALDDSLSNALSALSCAVQLQDRAGNLLSIQTTEDLSNVNKISYLTEDSRFGSTHGSWGQNGWRITTAVSIEANAENESGYRNLVIIGIIMVIWMFLLLILFTYLRLAKPIHKIQDFIEHVMVQPSSRLTMHRSDDIGTVAESLNRLLDDNQRHIHEIRENKILLYEVELSRQKMKVLAYRNQINPHFLYNTFACISGMALMNDQEEISELAMALSDIFRYAVKGGNIATVQKEVENIEKYAKIMEYRFMGKIKVQIKADKEVLDTPIIKLILQPIVENAVFHGLEPKMGEGHVETTVSRVNNRIRIVVSDDGLGIAPDQLVEMKRNYESIAYTVPESMRVPEYMKPTQMVEGTGRGIRLEQPDETNKSRGIGLGNIVQRLKLFYETDYSFQIESQEQKGTTIIITVPDQIRQEILDAES